MNCYLIEDDIATQFVLHTQLSKLNVQTEIHSDVSGLDQVIQNTPEKLTNALILMDINLPIEDGDKFLIRSLGDLKKIMGLKIVLLQDSSFIPEQLQDFDSIHACSKSELSQFVARLLN